MRVSSRLYTVNVSAIESDKLILLTYRVSLLVHTNKLKTIKKRLKLKFTQFKVHANNDKGQQVAFA